MQIYKVGGWVRDNLLDLHPSDCDYVVVGGSVKEMLKLGFKPVGRDFPVFLHPVTHEEYALARTERKTSVGYHGFEFYATPDVSLLDDLRRRDITINAMALDDNDQLIDPFNGKLDLARKLIRHVSPAFGEDPLRVLRVARFCAQLNFTIAKSTMRMMKNIAPELIYISKERISAEIHKGLNNQLPIKFLKVLHIVNALYIISPELAITWHNHKFRDKLAYLLDKIDNIHEKMAVLRYILNNSVEFGTFLNNESNSMAELLWVNFRKIVELQYLSTEDVWELINRLDIRRKPERYQVFVKLCNLIAIDDESIKHNLSDLDTIVDNLNELNWQQICANIVEVQDKIRYFKNAQLKIIQSIL